MRLQEIVTFGAAASREDERAGCVKAGCQDTRWEAPAHNLVCGCAGRLWDLRSGNSIMVLEGHVRGILSMDFSPNGYQL